MREDARRTCDSAVDTRKIRDLIRHDDVAYALSCKREGLAVRIADERILVILREVRHLAAVSDLAVRLIGNEEDRMIVFLLLLAKECGKFFNRLLRVYGAARIVRRIDNDALRPGRKTLLQGDEVNLKILRLGGHDAKIRADGLDKAAILGKERRKGDELVALLGERLEAHGDRRRRARRHEEVPARKVRAEALVDTRGKRFAHGGIARRNGVAVHRLRLHLRHDCKNRLLDEIGRRDIGIAEAEIADVFLPHLLRSLPAVLKDLADRRLLRAEFPHLFRYHYAKPSSFSQK